MSCCNRPPAGGPNNNEMGSMLKGIGVLFVLILALAYFFG